MVSLLKVVDYELADRRVVVHFGWPLSSWWDRLAVGVMVFNLMRLPRLFPQFEFDIRYFRRLQDARRSRRRGRAVTAAGAAGERRTAHRASASPLARRPTLPRPSP